MDRQRVLLIEDNPGDVRLIQEMLTEANPAFELQVADLLQNGLERLASGAFDIVLLDLNLPDGRGLATFLAVHEKAGDAPIVVLTGLDDETVAHRALQSGAQDYLVKGEVSGDWLARSLHYAVERARAGPVRAPLERENRRQRATTVRVGDVAVVRLQVKRLLDHESIRQLNESLGALAAQQSCNKILLNFTNVEYLSNAAMATLVEFHKKLGRQGGALRLCHLAPDVQAQLVVRRLDRVFDLKNDEQSALREWITSDGSELRR